MCAATAQAGQHDPTSVPRTEPICPASSVISVQVVHDGVAPPAGDQVAVDRDGDDEGDSEAEASAPQNSQLARPASIAPGISDQDQVVDDLHDRDREGVRGQGNRHRGGEARVRREDGADRQGVAEDERQGDGKDDRGQVAPARVRCR